MGLPMPLASRARSAARSLALGLTVAAATIAGPPSLAQEPVRFELDLTEERGGRPPTLRANEGAEVVITVRAGEAVEVHLHGYDRTAQATPDTPGVLRFTAETVGRYPLEVHGGGAHGHAPVLYLEVLPQ